MDYAAIIRTSQQLGLQLETSADAAAAVASQPIQNQKCNLVGASGLLVQIILGVLSFTVLVYKRIQERPQRQFKIWVLDSAKQVLSALFSHLANMLFSILLTESPTEQGFEATYSQTSASNGGISYMNNNHRHHHQSQNQDSNDPCNYYFVTVIIDTSIGVYLACELVSIIDQLLKRQGCEKLRSGNYYREAKVHVRWKLVDEMHNEMNVPIEQLTSIEIDYLVWLTQLAIWLTITFIIKMLLFMLQALFKTPLGMISEVLLFWLQNLPFFKLMFVMVLFPTIMNGLQFWIQDNFLKKKSYSADIEEIEEVDDNNPAEFERRQVEFNEAIAHANPDKQSQLDVQSLGNYTNNNCETRSAANTAQLHNAGMLKPDTMHRMRKGSGNMSFVAGESVQHYSHSLFYPADLDSETSSVQHVNKFLSHHG